MSTVPSLRVPRTGVTPYFVLTFVISWGIVVAVVGLDGFPGSEAAFREQLPAVVIAMLAGPSVAGVLLSVVHGGGDGLRDLWRRVWPGRISARWYALALLTAPITVSATLAVLSFSSRVFLPGIVTVSDPIPHLALGVVTGLVAGAFEEVGWTGVATPRLRRRYDAFGTGLIIGVLWGAWHLLVIWWGSTATAGSLSMLVYLPAMTLSFLPPYRVLMTWVHDRSQSIGVAMLMHASLTASVRVLDPVPIAGWPIVVYNLALGALLWGIIGVVVMARRRHGGAHG